MRVHTYHKTGSRHLQHNKTCQDRFLTGTVGTVQISAVADGHGHDAYTRAGLGARLACHIAYKTLYRSLKQGSLHFTEECAVQLGATIKKTFQRYINKHLMMHPLTEHEKEKLQEDTPETYVYGTTLMCSVLSDDGCMILKLGDGETHALNGNGDFLPLFPNYWHSDTGETQSMVQEEACFEICLLPKAPAVLLHFTDGYIYQGTYPCFLIESIKNESLSLNTIAQQGSNGDDSTILIITNETLLTDTFFAGFNKVTFMQEKEILISEYRKNARMEKQYLTLGLKKLEALKSSLITDTTSEIEELQKNLQIHFEKWNALLKTIDELEQAKEWNDIAI